MEDHTYTRVDELKPEPVVHYGAVNMCEKCGQSFSLKRSFLRHIKNAHSGRGSFKCLQADCSETFRRGELLKSHLTAAHNLKFVSKYKSFPNMKEFLVWKESFEDQTNTKYIRDKGTSKYKDKNVYYYKCHHSGVSRSKVETYRRPKANPETVKIGQPCTSIMIVTEYNNRRNIFLNFSKTHYGHSLKEIDHLFLTDKEKDTINARLARKITVKKLQESTQEKRDVRTVVRRNKAHVSKISIIEDDVNEHSDEMLSLKEWVQDNMQDVAFYKECGETSNFLEETDYALVIMTEEQCTLFKQFGNNRLICMNSTFDKRMCNFKIISLMLVDNVGVGIPLAFFCCNRDDIVALKLFVCAVKEKVGVINAKYFMSIDVPHYYDAWIQIMGDGASKLLSSWCLDKAWQSKLLKYDKVKQIEAFRAIKSVQYETNKEKFETLLGKLKTFLSTELSEFSYYFETEFASRLPEWAHCFRQGVPINTHVGLEALYHMIKYIYFKRKKVRRIDSTIVLLCNFIKIKIWERMSKMLKHKEPKDVNIEKYHNESLNNMNNRVARQRDDVSWDIISNQNTQYVVTKNMFLEDDHSCVLTCGECKTCIHAYMCTCFQYLIRGFMCRHIHFKCIKELKESSNEDGNYDDFVNDDGYDLPISIQHEVLTSYETADPIAQPEYGLEVLKNSLIPQIQNLADLINQCSDANILRDVSAHVRKSLNLFAIGSTDQEFRLKEPPAKRKREEILLVVNREIKADLIISKLKNELFNSDSADSL